MKRVHLIGIGGSGLSAIAIVLLESGIEVSGSDQEFSPLARQAQAAGAEVTIGHQAQNVSGADVVVRSSAIPDDNVEVQTAQAAGIPVLKRADFFSTLTSGRRVIAIAGTHGKTTCTSMVAWILTSMDLDPSYIIGGVSKNLGTNAHAGGGAEFVIEADEYDRMFLGLNPKYAVVTNVEHDHPDCYPTFDDFYLAFWDFIGRLEAGGELLFCEDDAGAARLRAQAQQSGLRTRTYGILDPGYDYYAHGLVPNSVGGTSFEALCTQESSSGAVQVSLLVPGEHNVRNALAALAVADMLGLALPPAAAALSEFQGTGRRFDVYDQVGGVILIDDYAHHPTEIRATLEAARQRYPERTIWAVWQPHTYSRTRTLLDGYTGAFRDADHVLVMDVYAAREQKPGDNFSAEQVVRLMEHPRVVFTPGIPEAKDALLADLGENDVVIVLSAGDANQLNRQLSHALRERSKTLLKSESGEGQLHSV